MSDQIVVRATATNDQIWTAIRDILKVIGSGLAMKGVIEGGYVEPAVGAVMVLAPIIWSQLVTRANHAKLWLLAQFAPDEVGKAVPKP